MSAEILHETLARVQAAVETRTKPTWSQCRLLYPLPILQYHLYLRPF